MCCHLPTQPVHPAVRPCKSKTILSQVHSFRTFAAFHLILLLDFWFLLRAPCCRFPSTANTQIQELQIPSIITFQTSYTSCLHCTCWRQQQKFIRQKLLAFNSCSIWHPQNGFAPSTPPKWHNLLSIILDPDRTILRSPSSLPLKVVYNPCTVSLPSSPSTHDLIQLLSCFSLRRLLENCPTLSLNYQTLHAPNSLSSLLALQSRSEPPLDQSICPIKSVWLLVTFQFSLHQTQPMLFFKLCIT